MVKCQKSDRDSCCALAPIGSCFGIEFKSREVLCRHPGVDEIPAPGSPSSKEKIICFHSRVIVIIDFPPSDPSQQPFVCNPACLSFFPLLLLPLVILVFLSFFPAGSLARSVGQTSAVPGSFFDRFRPPPFFAFSFAGLALPRLFPNCFDAASRIHLF